MNELERLRESESVCIEHIIELSDKSDMFSRLNLIARKGDLDTIRLAIRAYIAGTDTDGREMVFASVRDQEVS